jgi:hypothetical protein
MLLAIARKLRFGITMPPDWGIPVGDTKQILEQSYKPSVVTSKLANGGRVKTGQRTVSGTKLS